MEHKKIGKMSKEKKENKKSSVKSNEINQSLGKPLKTARWKTDINSACRKRGIEHAFALWQLIGGSKSTATDLFNDNIKMIRRETLDRLHNDVGISPYEIFVNEAES